MSGRMRLVKFIEYYTKFRKRFPTLKELERRTEKEKKIRKELMESDFHEINWDIEKDKDDKV